MNKDPFLQKLAVPHSTKDLMQHDAVSVDSGDNNTSPMLFQSRSAAAILLLLGLFPCVLSAQENDAVLQANKARAAAMAKEGHYEHVITQNDPSGKAPSPKLFSRWVLDEINKDSAMRDQIGDEVAAIQDNGRNRSRLIPYTHDNQYLGRLGFEPADLAIRRKGGKDHVYNYEVILKAEDAHHGGVTTKAFKYTFKAKSEHFLGTKAYKITVVSYPLYTGKTETE